MNDYEVLVERYRRLRAVAQAVLDAADYAADGDDEGWLERRMVDSLATYWLSEAGATAFEMNAMTTLEPGQQN